MMGNSRGLERLPSASKEVFVDCLHDSMGLNRTKNGIYLTQEEKNVRLILEYESAVRRDF